MTGPAPNVRTLLKSEEEGPTTDPSGFRACLAGDDPLEKKRTNINFKP